MGDFNIIRPKLFLLKKKERREKHPMAKKNYNIPTSIDKSYMDMEINLQTKDGIGGKPLPISLVVSYLVSILMGFFVLNKSFMVNALFFTKALYVILWLVLTVLLLRRDDTGTPQFSLVASMFNYLPKQKRYVTTRTTSRPVDFYHILGIENIDAKRGLIKFVDGGYGYMYQVVGSASILLFENDRDAILDQVDKFWRKVKTDAEWLFITVKEPQNVTKQIGSLKRRYDALDNDDPDLKGLANTQYKILSNIVGKEYRSIHQYLILRAENPEVLTVAKNVLQGEVENSSLMFKQCTALFDDDLYRVLSSIYRGEESI